MSYLNQISFCGNYSAVDDQYPNNGSFNSQCIIKNYGYCYDNSNPNGYQSTIPSYCVPTQTNIQDCSYGYENNTYATPEMHTNQQSPINTTYQNFNDNCYASSSTPSSNSSSFTSQGTPEYNSFSTNNSENLSFTSYCEYPSYQECCVGIPASNMLSPVSTTNYDCCDSMMSNILNQPDFQNYQDNSNIFNCSQNGQFNSHTNNECAGETYHQSPIYPDNNSYTHPQNFSQMNNYCQNQGIPIEEEINNISEENYKTTLSNKDIFEDINMVKPVEYQTPIQRSLTVEISNFILRNINSIFLNFTLRLLSSPKYQRICFWSRISWEFIIADPLAFTKVFADEYTLNKNYITFSHVSKAYKIVEASTIYGQHIITRVKSKRNTWRFFPDHDKMGFPSLKNAGGSTLAGTILNAEEMKFLTKLRRKLDKIPNNHGTSNKVINNDRHLNYDVYETPRIRRF